MFDSWLYSLGYTCTMNMIFVSFCPGFKVLAYARHYYLEDILECNAEMFSRVQVAQGSCKFKPICDCPNLNKFSIKDLLEY